VTDRLKAAQSSADDENKPVVDDDSRKVVNDADETKKSVPPRNRELERLGVVSPPVGDSRRPAAVKKSADDDVDADGKSSAEILPNSHPAADDKSPTASADESLTSETDVDLTSMSDEDITDDSDTEDVMSDDDSEVIIVSETKGKNHGSVNSKKVVGDRSSGSAVALATATFKKPTTTTTQHVVSHSRSSSALNDLKQASSSSSSSSSSSWWVNKVNLLETAMAEMKSKFAEVLRQKVSL